MCSQTVDGGERSMPRLILMHRLPFRSTGLASPLARDRRHDRDRRGWRSPRRSHRAPCNSAPSRSGHRVRSTWSWRSTRPSTRRRRPRSSARASLTSSRSEPAGDRAASAATVGLVANRGARLTDAGRTLTLATDPHPRLARYVLPLPSGAEPIPPRNARRGRNQLRPFRCRGRLDPGRQPGRSTTVDGLVAAASISKRRAG